MRTKIMLVSMLIMLTSMPGVAQSKKPGSQNLLARLSYDRTSVVRSEQEGPSRICLALYQSGRYKVLMDTERGTEFLGGELSPYQLGRLSKMLEDLDFESSGANLIHRGSESFEAEVHSSNKTKRYVWVDPDHQRPFPKSAVSVVNWLRNFRAEGASPVALGEFSEQQTCPSETSLVPLTAGLIEGLGVSSCGRH